MGIPKMPVKGLLQIPAILAMFFVALILSRHLWSVGDRAVAGLPLLIYTCVVTRYSTEIRLRGKV
jgi:hypothetical protein